ncbi:MAG: peptidylprolyl isomerase [Planctomycetota bacterium]
MERNRLTVGATLPAVLALALAAPLGLVGCKGGDPDASTGAPVEDALDGAADAADDAADTAIDAVGDAADAADAAGETLDDVTNGVEDAADAADAAGDAVEEAVNEVVESAQDLTHPDGLNRFAAGGKIDDAAMASYWTSMEIEIDGEPKGTMTFELWPDGAPITVRNHLRLVDEGFYDGLTVHRIIRNFMVQGGCPNGNGAGNSPHGTIQAEFSRAPERSHEYGVLSMARTQAPNTASSQFFIVCDNRGGKQLDGSYATFGRLTSGVSTLEAIATVRPRDGNGMNPAKRVVIVDAEVHEGTPPKGETIQRPN